MKTDNIILFDGVCNLCNSAVNLIIKKDKHQLYTFTPLQSDYGKALLKFYRLKAARMDSRVLIRHDKVYLKSSAALHIAKTLGGLNSLLYGFIIVPPFLRNFFYDTIAKNRYKWFGKQNECVLPSAELRARFLE